MVGYSVTEPLPPFTVKEAAAHTCDSCGGSFYGRWSEHATSDEHFWRRVAKGDGCWEWQGATNRKGYGVYSQGTAHREAWRRANGPIPVGLWVLHSCDNPPCVRPDHLWLGTAADNNRDRDAKGRHAKGLTHCKKGHSFDYITPAGWHLCRICRLERQRRYVRPSRAGYVRPSRRKVA